MSNGQLGLLIAVIVGVGVMIAFGPRFLDQQQAERDKSTDCMMFRSFVDFAIDYQKLEQQAEMQRTLGEALDYKAAGNCSDYKGI